MVWGQALPWAPYMLLYARLSQNGVWGKTEKDPDVRLSGRTKLHNNLKIPKKECKKKNPQTSDKLKTDHDTDIAAFR